ncbi:inner membrane complex protein 1f, putative [Plasmodium gallinaceum]|uniref:Inner membrane complex protein 1f, putative n=1 Tax=Plasmodium gallinaceum TaxID=5849 RepID=A0A1J1GSH2_PLAGA|nr:inner membrane complex protein 1f, putative [Plasmodium gallinaceum]CRG95223.1 inner membrane complex protein 1f, putative [Plasmodium gallinaceum]
MLKSTTKTDSTKRDQNRKLLQKKLSKDSVTSTKFCDSSEEREAGSNTSSNVSIKILEKLNNTRNLNANNTDSFIYDIKTSSNVNYKKIDKNNSQELNSTNILNKVDNTSTCSVIPEKAKRSDRHSDENNISSKLNSNKIKGDINNQENIINIQTSRINNDILNTEKNNKTNLNKALYVSSDPKNISHTITFRDNSTKDENNIYYNPNNNSHFYSDNKSKHFAHNFNSNTTDFLSSYSNNNFNSYIDNNLSSYVNNSLNSYANNNFNYYTSNNLNSYSNKNIIIDQKLRSPFPYLSNFECTSKRLDTFNTSLDTNCDPNISNEMDFLNMYSSHTPMGSNNSNILDSSQYMNGNPYSPDNSYFNSTSYNITSEVGNYNNIVDKNICDNNVSSTSYFTNDKKSNDGKIEETSNYIDHKYNNITDKSLINNDIFKSKPIRENELVRNDVSYSEKISSHTDYSRAKHSSHVIDKRIVHEGFDTIKIPKYREVEVVEKIVEVPVVHKVNKYINKYEIKEVEKMVKKPIKKYVETKIEVPELHFQDKIVEVPELQEIVKIVEKPEIKERIIYKNRVETKIIPKYIEVPVVKIVNRYEEYDDIGEVIKTVPVKKIVEIPNEVIKQVKIPVRKIIEKPNYVPIIKYRDVPIEKIRYVPKIQTVELVKTIPKIIDVPVPVKVPKIKIIDKPYYINKYIDKPVVVPVSKRIKPIYKYEGKKIIEVPIHKPYIVTHDTVISKNIENNITTGKCSVYTKKLDLNSLSPMKRNELFNIVNTNNFNLQRSMSVDNIFNNQNFSNNNLFNNMNINENKENNKPLSNVFSKFDYNEGQQFLSKNNLNCLKFSKSLNNNINMNENNLNSIENNSYLNNSIKEANIFSSNEMNDPSSMQKLVCNNNSLPRNYSSINPLVNNAHKSGQVSTFEDSKYGLNFQKNINNQSLPFPKSTRNSVAYMNDINNLGSTYYVENCNNISDMNKLPNQINSNMNKFEDTCLNRYKSKFFSNIPYEDYGNSNNLNNFHGIRNNNMMRSSSPSVCSADGISAYVVEYVGDQNRKVSDSAFSKGLNNDFTEEIGSNYSFSGTLINSTNE